MRVHPRGLPQEPGEAIQHDGSAESAARLIAWCGPDHARIAEDGALMVWRRDHVGHEELIVPVGGLVVNPHRGNFLVLTAEDFLNGWEVAGG